MTSLAEMLQAGQYIDSVNNENSPVGRIASMFNAGLSGIAEGRQLRAQDAALKRQAIDDQFRRAGETLKIQKDQSDIQTEAQNRRIAQNFGKSIGLLPLDENETGIARDVAFDGLGGGTPPAVDNSGAGRVATLFSKTTPYNLPKASFSEKGGLSFTMERAEQGDAKPKDPVSDNAKIRSQAEDMARKEKFNMISSILPPDQAAKYANVQPTEDEVQKYIPEAQAYLRSDSAGAAKARSARSKTAGYDLDALKTIQGITTGEGVGDGLLHFAAKGKAAALDARNALLLGKTSDEVIPGLIDQLNEDPNGNAGALAALARIRIKKLTGGK